MAFDYQQPLFTNSLRIFIILQLGESVVAMDVLILHLESEVERIKTVLGNFNHHFLLAPSIEAANHVLKENEIDLIIAPSHYCDQQSLTTGRPGRIPLIEIASFNGSGPNHKKEPVLSFAGD